jgi:hypothetical protein
MRAFLVGLSLLTLAACGSSGTGPDGQAAISGVFNLTSVDNKPLPAAFPDSTLQSGTLTVTDSGWTQSTVVRYAAGGNPAGDVLTQGGGWVTNGSNVTLYDYTNTTTYTGTFTSTSISLTTKTATVLGYSKQ